MVPLDIVYPLFDSVLMASIMASLTIGGNSKPFALLGSPKQVKSFVKTYLGLDL